MRRSTLTELADDPVGRYVAGATWVHYCAAPTLWGTIVWGEHDEAQAHELGRALVPQYQPPAVPHASLMDLSRLERIDPASFAAAGRYLSHNHDTLKRGLTRLAIVRPGGHAGAVVAGAFEVLPRPYPAKVFADVAAACAWLASEGADGWPADLPALVAQMHAEVSSTPAFLGALRAVLAEDLSGVAVADAAKRLGVSERTLQRKLGELGTSFQDEVASARLHAARRMLVETDAPLTNIAMDAGFGSPQHFSALFKKREGVTPSEYRRLHRKS